MATALMTNYLQLQSQSVRGNIVRTPRTRIMDTPADEVTSLLHAWKAGDRTVEQKLFELVWPDLHKLAEHLMQGERSENSLQPTALINEAYCRLVKTHERDWQNRQHFFAVAARA